MAVTFNKVDSIPKATRKGGTRKYLSVVQHVQETGETVQIEETFTNTQVAGRINDQFGEEYGIHAVTRRNGEQQPKIDRETGEHAVDENGEVKMQDLYVVYIEPASDEAAEDDEDDDDDDDE